MHNNNKSISASEINKYCYCNYQWYYGRVYGNSTLFKLNREKLEELGIEYKEGNFKKGLDYHKNFRFKWNFVFITKTILLIIIIFYIISKATNGF